MKAKTWTLLGTAVLPTLILFGLILQLTLPTQALAATVTVTTTADENDGCGAGTGCSLREAVGSAASGGTISLPAGTYLLSLGQINLAQDLTIQGAGSSATLVDGGSTNRVFSLTGGSAITLTGMTLQNGSAANGGGISISFFSALGKPQKVFE